MRAIFFYQSWIFSNPANTRIPQILTISVSWAFSSTLNVNELQEKFFLCSFYTHESTVSCPALKPLYFPSVNRVMTFPGGTTFTPVNSCCLPLLITVSWTSIRPLMNKIASRHALPHSNLMMLDALSHILTVASNWAHPLFLQAFTRIEAPHLCGQVSRRLVCLGCFYL